MKTEVSVNITLTLDRADLGILVSWGLDSRVMEANVAVASPTTGGGAWAVREEELLNDLFGCLRDAKGEEPNGKP